MLTSYAYCVMILSSSEAIYSIKEETFPLFSHERKKMQKATVQKDESSDFYISFSCLVAQLYIIVHSVIF